MIVKKGGVAVNSSKADIFNKLRSNECANKFKAEQITTVILFGSILTEEFEDYSDVDIAVLSEKDIDLHTILSLEGYLEKLLNKDVDVINLRDRNLDLNMKVTIYDNGTLIYDNDNLKLYNIDYEETERLYKDNETFRYFRERDVIFDE